jgi:recombination protein RecA
MAQDKKELTKEEKLDSLIKKLNQDFGSGTIITNETLPEIERFSSGSFSLDKALGGGWARGRVIEIAGNESAGKSSIALHAVTEIQRLGGTAAYLDQEHSLDGSYAKSLGVNLKDLIIVQAFCAEDCLDIADELSSSGIIDLVVIDSVAALVPRAELEGNMADTSVGLQARLMSKAMRMMTGPAAKNGTTVMFINQFRSKITMYGSGGKVGSGGLSLKYYASQRLELFRPNKPVEKNGEPIGIQVEAKVIKNKCAAPFKQASLFIRWGKGIDKYIDVLRVAVENNIVQKGGAWYTYKDLKVQGEDNMAEAIKENKLYEELVEKLK